MTVIWFASPVFCGFAQSKEALSKKKKQLEKEIEFTGKILKETEKHREASLNHLATLKKKIALRQELIKTIGGEIRALRKQIDEQNNIIKSLEKDLIKIKNDYSQMLYYAYKNRSQYARIMFVFAASDFNQAYKRLKYLQHINEFRKKLVATINSTKSMIDKKVAELEIKKSEKLSLLRREELENQLMSKERKEQNQIYAKLQDKEKQLKGDIMKKHTEAKKLQKAIEDIIAEELRRAREAAKKATGFALTPEERQLSDVFAKNKGKLPWPVEKGVITGNFGQHEHAVLKGIMINNNGIDITTNKGSVARAVFNGKVTGVIVLPGTGKKAVIVRHGGYFSVYGNLTHVYVKKGDNVETKQDIGLLYTDEKKYSTEAHLEIWKMTDKGTVKVDPQKWLMQ